MLRLCSLLVLCLLPTVALSEFSGIVRVIDGDTIDVGQTRVRLHAIDAPEMEQSCVSRAGVPLSCGTWVTRQVRGRFEGQRARCVARDRDRYGRTVATCTVGGVDMGAEIVAQGWAFAYRRYGMDYDLDEKAAFVARRGLHGMEVQSPAAFRAEQRAAPVAQGDCMIKGNISGSGRIYHMPGQEHYDRTRISPSKGERMFCSEAEARAAGWRRARR